MCERESARGREREREEREDGGNPRVAPLPATEARFGLRGASRHESVSAGDSDTADLGAALPLGPRRALRLLYRDCRAPDCRVTGPNPSPTTEGRRIAMPGRARPVAPSRRSASARRAAMPRAGGVHAAEPCRRHGGQSTRRPGVARILPCLRPGPAYGAGWAVARRGRAITGMIML